MALPCTSQVYLGFCPGSDLVLERQETEDRILELRSGQDVPGLSQPMGNMVDAMAERHGLHAVVGCDAMPSKGDQANPATDLARH